MANDWNYAPSMRAFIPGAPTRIMRNLEASHAFALNAKYGGTVWQDAAPDSSLPPSDADPATGIPYGELT